MTITISAGMCDEWFVYGYPPIFPPKSRDYDQVIPGKHGEYAFDSDYESRQFTLRLVSPRTTDKETYRHALFAMFPLVTTDLVFETLHHYVILDGDINFQEYAYNLDASIPLRMCDPFAYSAEISASTPGTVANVGGIETFPVFEITGAITDPSVTLGTDVLAWTGTVSAGETLVINCDKKTVKKGTANCLKDYTGGFPSCPIGNTSFAGTNATVKWRNRYI